MWKAVVVVIGLGLVVGCACKRPPAPIPVIVQPEPPTRVSWPRCKLPSGERCPTGQSMLVFWCSCTESI